MTARNMIMISLKAKCSGLNIPFRATSIIPLENTAPTSTPAAAIASIILNEAAFEPMAELRKLTASLLTPLWKYEPGEADLTVMRLVISGIEEGKPATYTYDMVDEYDPATGTPSMARTTGYTCTAVARMVLDGTFTQKGIIPPEYVGRVDGCWRSVEQYLKDRDVCCKMQRS